MSRKKARDNAFKLIFEVPFFNNDFLSRIDIFNEIKEDNLTENDINYITSSVTACYENIEKIDHIISSNLKNWTIDRIPNVSKAIMRLAVCEMLYIDDVPYQVAVNEAIELAKVYGDDDSPSFINGVLASIIKSENIEGNVK